MADKGPRLTNEGHQGSAKGIQMNKYTGGTLGEKLIALRGTRTQQEVAEALDIPTGRFGNYERNRNEPDIATLSKIAEYFNVTLDWLLADKRPMPAN